MTPRVLAADDHTFVLEQVRKVLNNEFALVGCVGDGAEVLEAVPRLAPDVLVLDISMPVMNGLCCAARLREAGCKLPIVFLTVHGDREYVRAVQEVGGLGYVLKERMASDLVPAVKAALAGCPFLSEPLRAAEV